jgi:hypothetical protein
MTLRWNKKVVVAYHNWWNSPDGQIVLEDLKKRNPLLTEGLKIDSGVDVNRLLVLEGQNNVLKYIYKMLKRDPNEEQPEKARNEPINR